MGYSITIIGHKAVEAAEDAIAFEQSIVDKVKAFVDELEGVVTASGSFEQLGGVTLKSEETTDGAATPEPTPPLASEDPNNPNPQPEA